MLEVDGKVEKIIAKDGERIIEPSSYEEFIDFYSDDYRQEFNDKSILGIKFRIYAEYDENSFEETNWYLNPCIKELITRHTWNYLQNETGPELAGNVLPEIIFLDSPKRTRSIFEYYDEFYYDLLSQRRDNSVPDTEKYDLFIAFISSV